MRLSEELSLALDNRATWEAFLAEGVRFPVGAVRTWKRGGKEVQFKKMGHKEWVPLSKIEREASHAVGKAKQALADALRDGVKTNGGVHRLADMSFEEHLAEGEKFLAKHQKALDESIGTLKGMFPGMRVYGRVKSLDSAIGKLLRKPQSYKKVSDLQDGSGMRIVGKTYDDVRKIVADIEKKFDVVGRDDYMDGHPANGDYRSYHMVIRTPDGAEQELQIRTESQDRWGDWFHDAYKPRNEAQKKVLEKHKDDIDSYSSAISSHFAARDQGKASRKPDCPPAVRSTFGCL